MMPKTLLLASAFGLCFLLPSCDNDDPQVPVTYDPTPVALDYGRFPDPQLPPDNPLTVQGVRLGRMLFYEKMLSGDNTQSCASCHLQAFAFTDTATLSLGIRGMRGHRNAMSVFNMAWHDNEFFWDGRAHLLRDQSLRPIQDPLEMDESLDDVVAKLEADKRYRDQFIRAFGDELITPQRIALAMEQFMHTIVSNRSKYDRFLRGEVQLTADEERGRFLFFTEFNPFFPAQSGADCAHCHGGDNFENDMYMNNGLDDPSGMMLDRGREMVTMNPNDRGKFKVMSLRNIEVTPPYMHDGRFRTLEEVVDHYDHGLHPSPTLDPALDYTRVSGGLQLTPSDKVALVAFLRTLTDHAMLTDTTFADPF
jgi:cytochrome c peroxidase